MIRRAEPHDAAAIADVHVRSWQGAYAHVFPPEGLAGLSIDRRREAWERTLASPPPRSRVLVAEDDGRLVGFTSVGPSRDDDALEASGELYAIYVLPEQSGRGVGRALMGAALAALRMLGFAEAVLWVLVDNPRARRFYEAAGWRTDGAEKRDEFLDTPVLEVRYRIDLA